MVTTPCSDFQLLRISSLIAVRIRELIHNSVRQGGELTKTTKHKTLDDKTKESTGTQQRNIFGGKQNEKVALQRLRASNDVHMFFHFPAPSRT